MCEDTFEYFQKASEQDHRSAHYMLGYLHINNMIQESNNIAAYHHFKQASESESFNTINKYYYLQSKYELANCLISGIGCKRDFNNGLKILEQIGVDGNNNASYKLYLIYNNGKYGVPINTLRALAWLKHASQLGNKDAQNEITQIYIDKGKQEIDSIIPDVKKWQNIDTKVRNIHSIKE